MVEIDRKVGIYLRLSREDEKLGESGSITNQRAILMDYIERNHLKFVSEYVDDGVSGTTFDRVGFQKMIFDIEHKKINMVITKDTSRLGRDHIDFGYYVEKYFPEHNVRYVAVCDDIDTENQHNDMLLFKSAYNDMYVKDISNKIRSSLHIKKKNGEFVGAYAPYGYVKDKLDKHKLLIDDDAALVVRDIYHMFLKGYSISRIANVLTDKQILTPSLYKNMNLNDRVKVLGKWSTRTVQDILTNPTYMGNLTQGRCKKINYKSKRRVHVDKDLWIIKENSCPAIISKDLFLKVQDIYCSRKYSNSENSSLLLKGFVYCKECGHRISFRRVKSRYYGNCNYYLKYRKYHLCTNHSISYQTLYELVMQNVMDTLKLVPYDSLLNKVREKVIFMEDNYIRKHILELKNEKSLVKMKMVQLYDDKLNGLIDKDIYISMKRKLSDRDNEIGLELVTYQDKLQKDCYDVICEYMDSILKKGEVDSFLLSSLIDKIILSDSGDIRICYKVSL